MNQTTLLIAVVVLWFFFVKEPSAVVSKKPAGFNPQDYLPDYDFQRTPIPLQP